MNRLTEHEKHTVHLADKPYHWTLVDGRLSLRPGPPGSPQVEFESIEIPASTIIRKETS